MDKNFKSNFSFALNIIFLVFIIFGGLVWADTNGIWHLAEDVRPGIFGSDEGIISGYSFVNPVSFNDDVTYKNIELDTRYINEGQANSVSSGMIVDGSIGIVDVNSAQIQARVSGTCAAGQSIRAISSTGTVTCEADDSGLTSESDPTVLASVKDGVSWSEVSSIPAGFADGVDNGITAESDPQVGTLTNGKWCTSDGTKVNCASDAPSSGGINFGDTVPSKVCNGYNMVPDTFKIYGGRIALHYSGGCQDVYYLGNNQWSACIVNYCGY